MCADPALRYPAHDGGGAVFFVLSCVLSLSPPATGGSKAQNLSILSYLANQYDTPIIAWLSPIIAFVAITKSFLGHYIGAYESLRDLILEAAAARGEKTWYSPRRRGHPGVYGAYLLVRRVQEPQYPRYYRMHQRSHRAAILLLLPMYAIHKLPVLAPGAVKRATFSSP